MREKLRACICCLSFCCFFEFEIIVGELSEQRSDVCGGALGVGGDFFVLQAEQEQTIEEIHADTYFFVVAASAFCAQFNDIGQHLVVHLTVVGILVVLQQPLVRLFQFLEQVFVNLEMATLSQALANHHLAMVLVPFFIGSAVVVVVEGKAREVFRFDAVEVQIVGTQNILYLPEIEEMLNTTFPTELLGYFHDKEEGEN